MKHFILILIVMIFSSHMGKSFCYKTFFWELIEKADVIVSGKIVSIDDKTFKIQLIEKIKGSVLSDSIIIKKYTDWEYPRYSNYLVGQCGVYFLKVKFGKFEILGSTDEGELILMKDSVFINDAKGRIYSNISKYRKFKILSYRIVANGILDYIQNQNQIDLEFQNYFSRTSTIVNSYLDKPFKNEFLDIILNERRDYPKINLR